MRLNSPTNKQAAYQHPASQLTLPIQLPLDNLRELANSELPRELYDEQGLNLRFGLTLALRVLRTGKVEMYTMQGRLMTTLPVRIRGSIRWRLGPLQANLPFSARLLVRLRTRVWLTAHYQLGCQSEADFSYQRKPALRIQRLSLKIGRWANPLIEKQMDEFSSAIDRYLVRVVDLRDILTGVWRRLEQPFQLTEQPPRFWLQIHAQEISYPVVLSRTKQILEFNVGLQGLLSIRSGAAPNPNPQRALPTLNHVSQTKAQFKLHAPLYLTYQDFGLLLKQWVLDQEFPIRDNFLLKVLEIYLKPYRDRLYVELLFQVKDNQKKDLTEGRIRLSGIPEINPKNQQLKIGSLSYSLDTENFLFNLFGKVLHDALLDNLQEMLQLDLGPSLKKVQQELQEVVSSMQVSEYIHIKGEIEALQLEDLAVLPEHLRLDLSSAGQPSSTITRL